MTTQLRTLEPYEQKMIARSRQQNWIPTLFASNATPIHEKLANEVKTSLLWGGSAGTVGALLYGAHPLSLATAAIGGTVGLALGLWEYMSRTRTNDNLEWWHRVLPKPPEGKHLTLGDLYLHPQYQRYTNMKADEASKKAARDASRRLNLDSAIQITDLFRKKG